MWCDVMGRGWGGDVMGMGKGGLIMKAIVVLEVMDDISDFRMVRGGRIYNYPNKISRYILLTHHHLPPFNPTISALAGKPITN